MRDDDRNVKVALGFTGVVFFLILVFSIQSAVSQPKQPELSFIDQKLKVSFVDDLDVPTETLFQEMEGSLVVDPLSLWRDSAIQVLVVSNGKIHRFMIPTSNLTVILNPRQDQGAFIEGSWDEASQIQDGISVRIQLYPKIYEALRAR